MCIPGEITTKMVNIHRENPIIAYRAFEVDDDGGSLKSTYMNRRYSMGDDGSVVNATVRSNQGFHSFAWARDAKSNYQKAAIGRVQVFGSVVKCFDCKGMLIGYRSSGMKIDAMLSRITTFGPTLRQLKRAASRYRVPLLTRF